MAHTFHGVWPALVTPFTPDDEISFSVLRNLVQYLLDKNVDGFYVGGTTGEGVFMTVEERKQVIDAVLSEINGRVPVIVHVGSMVYKDAVALARHAEARGAVGVSSIVPPLYASLDSLVDYFRTVAQAVPNLPVFPYFLSQSIEPLALMRRLLDIPNVKGTKYTGPDMHEFRQIVELGGDAWTVFSGMDEVCVFAAMLGARGNIGSTLNFMPGVYKHIRAHVERGEIDQALALQLKANRVTAVLLEGNLMGNLKGAMNLIGFECGGLRLPRAGLDPQQIVALETALQATDFDALVAL